MLYNAKLSINLIYVNENLYLVNCNTKYVYVLIIPGMHISYIL